MTISFTDPTLILNSPIKKVYKDELVISLNTIITNSKETDTYKITINNTGTLGLTTDGLQKIKDAINSLEKKWSSNCNCGTNPNCCQTNQGCQTSSCQAQSCQTAACQVAVCQSVGCQTNQSNQTNQSLRCQSNCY